MIKLGAKNVPNSCFLDFGAFRGERNLDGKSGPKIKQIGKMKPESRLHGIFGGRTSEEAGQAEALELASSQMFVQHASHPRGGRRIYGQSPHPQTSEGVFFAL